MIRQRAPRANLGAAQAVATVVAAAQAHHDSNLRTVDGLTFGDGAEELRREVIASLAARGLVMRVNGSDYVGLGVSTNVDGEGCLEVEKFDEESGDGTGEVYDIPWSEVEAVHVY